MSALASSLCRHAPAYTATHAVLFVLSFGSRAFAVACADAEEERFEWVESIRSCLVEPVTVPADFDFAALVGHHQARVESHLPFWRLIFPSRFFLVPFNLRVSIRVA